MHLSAYSDSGMFYTGNDTDPFTLASCTGISNNLPRTSFIKFAGKTFIGLTSGLHTTTDNGHTWSMVPVQPCANPKIRCLYASNDTLYVGVTGYGIFRTTDSANSWTFLDSVGLDEVDQIVVVNGVIVIGGTHKLQYSTDHGNSWITTSNPVLKNSSFLYGSLISHDNALFASGWFGLYRSDNSGLTWTMLSGQYLNTMIFVDNFLIANFNYGQKIRVSSNNGISFVPLDSGLNVQLGSIIGNFSYNDDLIIAGIYSGCPCVDSTVYVLNRHDLAALAVKTIKEEPAAYKIYPNPASEKITLHSNESHTNSVSVLINDITGRVAGSYDFAGFNDMEIPVNNLTPGVYFLHINDGGNIEIHKLVISR